MSLIFYFKVRRCFIILRVLKFNSSFFKNMGCIKFEKFFFFVVRCLIFRAVFDWIVNIFYLIVCVGIFFYLFFKIYLVWFLQKFQKNIFFLICFVICFSLSLKKQRIRNRKIGVSYSVPGKKITFSEILRYKYRTRYRKYRQRYSHVEICLSKIFFNETDVYNLVSASSFPEYFLIWIRPVNTNFFKHFFVKSLSSRFHRVNNTFCYFKYRRYLRKFDNNFFWYWKFSPQVHNYGLRFDFSFSFPLASNRQVVEMLFLILERIHIHGVYSFTDFSIFFKRQQFKKIGKKWNVFVVFNLKKSDMIFPIYEGYKIIIHLYYYILRYVVNDMKKSLFPINYKRDFVMYTAFKTIKFSFNESSVNGVQVPYYYTVRVSQIEEVRFVPVRIKVAQIKKIIMRSKNKKKAILLTGTSSFYRGFLGLPFLNFLGEIVAVFEKEFKFCIFLIVYCVVVFTYF